MQPPVYFTGARHFESALHLFGLLAWLMLLRSDFYILAQIPASLHQLEDIIDGRLDRLERATIFQRDGHIQVMRLADLDYLPGEDDLLHL